MRWLLDWLSAQPTLCVHYAMIHNNIKYHTSSFSFATILQKRKICAIISIHLPVAQLDSARDSDSRGRRFKSCRAGQKNDKILQNFVVFQLCLPWRARGVVFDSDVHCVSDVSPIGEVGKHYITATIGSNITMRSITSLWLAATSLLSHEFKSIMKNEN